MNRDKIIGAIIVILAVFMLVNLLSVSNNPISLLLRSPNQFIGKYGFPLLLLWLFLSKRNR